MQNTSIPPVHPDLDRVHQKLAARGCKVKVIPLDDPIYSRGAEVILLKPMNASTHPSMSQKTSPSEE